MLNVQYIIGLNHSQKALLTYADGRKLSLECGLDEEWIVNSTDNLLSNSMYIEVLVYLTGLLTISFFCIRIRNQRKRLCYD